MMFINIDKIVEELDQIRRKYKDITRSSISSYLRRRGLHFPKNTGNIRIAHLVNEVASVFNKYWGDKIKVLLEGKSAWKNSYNFLQDIIGDEAKKNRALIEWITGNKDTREFVEIISSRIITLLKGN